MAGALGVGLFLAVGEEKEEPASERGFCKNKDGYLKGGRYKIEKRSTNAKLIFGVG
jgi:hypothetical protein